MVPEVERESRGHLGRGRERSRNTPRKWNGFRRRRSESEAKDKVLPRAGGLVGAGGNFQLLL